MKPHSSKGNFNPLTWILIAVILSFIAIPFILPGQSSRNSGSNPQLPSTREVEVILREKAAGLDLAAVTALAKSAKNAEEFEQKLNAKSEAINNLDLNDDGKTDYINITEYGSGDQRGFSLTTEIAPGKTQEIATIDFEKKADGMAVQTAGNPSLYGPGHYHHSHFSMTDALMLYWLFSDRPSYRSPYTHSYPPSYGGGWSPRSSWEYERAMQQRRSGTLVTTSSSPTLKPLSSPNANQTAAKAQALLNPTQSQRSFGTSPSKPQASGGFGRSSTSTNSRPSTSSSSYSPPPSRPSSFGGFGRSTSSSFSRSGSFSGGGK